MTVETAITYRFFIVEPQPLAPRRKTRDYHLVSRQGGETIGVVRWYGGWRQWCFFPAASSMWDDGCLADVHDFIGRLKGAGK